MPIAAFFQARSGRSATILRLGVVILLLLAWDIAARMTGSVWVSSPTLVGMRLVEWLGGSLYGHLIITLEEIFVGVAAVEDALHALPWFEA